MKLQPRVISLEPTMCSRCHQDVSQENRAVFGDELGHVVLCASCFNAVHELREALSLQRTSTRSTLELERTFS
jgi:hypothetical protein